MEYAIGYVAIIFVLQALAAIRTPHQDCQVVIVASLLWPLMVVLIASSFLLDAIGWDFDLVKGKWIGFRKPVDNWPGFAISVLKMEFQFWKKRTK